jgi:tripartite-type tricarboxylate transporter receptor subunit TctC
MSKGMRLGHSNLNKLFLAAFLLCLNLSSYGQNFPNKSIHIVIGFPPGGAIDTLSRVLAPKISKDIGQPVLIDNKAGAGGIIGMQFVANAEPDGYTLFLGTLGNFCITPAANKDLPYKVQSDFLPITQVAASPFIIFVNPLLPVNNVAELISYAKSRPGKVYFSSSGNGGLPHIAGEIFNQLAGTQLVHIPYKGSAPGITDVIGGQVQLTFEAVAIGLPYLKSGRLRAIAITDTKRSSLFPEVPTVSETIPNFALRNWFGLVAPKNTPPKAAEIIQKSISKALKDPEVLKTLNEFGFEPIGDSSNEYAQFMLQESNRWRDFFAKNEIKIN